MNYFTWTTGARGKLRCFAFKFYEVNTASGTWQCQSRAAGLTTARPNRQGEITDGAVKRSHEKKGLEMGREI